MAQQRNQHSPKAVITRWFEEIWNQGRLETQAELLARDCEIHTVSAEGEVVTEYEDFRAMFRRMAAGFADIHFDLEDIVEQDDRVAVRWRARMRHRANAILQGAPERPVEVTGMTFCRMRDGKIVEGWDCWDIHGLHRQLRA